MDKTATLDTPIGTATHDTWQMTTIHDTLSHNPTAPNRQSESRNKVPTGEWQGCQLHNAINTTAPAPTAGFNIPDPTPISHDDGVF